MKRIIISCVVAFCLMPVLAQRRIGVMLPFQSAGALSQSMVEFYRGLLMAADSVSRQGMSVEIHALDAGITGQSMQETLLRHNVMQEMDVLVGPGVPDQTNVLADFCRQHQIQLLMPFNTPYADLAQNANAYQCVAPHDVVYDDVVRLVMDKFIDAHFVLLQTNHASERGKAMQAILRRKLEEMGFSYNVLNVNDDGEGIERAMNITRRNVVLSDSPSHQAMQHCVGLLERFLNNNSAYKVSLLGYHEWLDYTDSYASHFHVLDTYLFTTYYNNPLSGRTIRFKQQYAENFHQQHPAMRPSLSMLGFDLGLYVMGDAAPSAALQNTFHFAPVAEGGGSINHHVQLVHFGKNHVIQVEK